MKIYISHKRRSNFLEELYLPIKNSPLAKKHQFIFPHESDAHFDSKDAILNKKIDAIIAEVSFPATGQGIELGWADTQNIPIICIFKTGSEIAGSLKTLTDNFIEYGDAKDLIEKLSREIDA